MASLTDLLLQYGNNGGSNNDNLGFGTMAGLTASPDYVPTASASTGGFLGGLGDLFSKNSFLGGTNPNGTQSMGWAMPAVGIAQAIMGGINGMKQTSLAEDNLKEGKRQFQLNYDAQKQSTNTQLEDRQRARVASNPGGGYESVSTYLDKNKIR